MDWQAVALLEGVVMTPPQTIPAPGFQKNPGKFPDMLTPDTKLRVQFGNGCIDDKHTYTPSQLRWSNTWHEWDVAAVAVADVS